MGPPSPPARSGAMSRPERRLSSSALPGACGSPTMRSRATTLPPAASSLMRSSRMSCSVTLKYGSKPSAMKAAGRSASKPWRNSAAGQSSRRSIPIQERSQRETAPCACRTDSFHWSSGAWSSSKRLKSRGSGRRNPRVSSPEPMRTPCLAPALRGPQEMVVVEPGSQADVARTMKMQPFGVGEPFVGLRPFEPHRQVYLRCPEEGGRERIGDQPILPAALDRARCRQSQCGDCGAAKGFTRGDHAVHRISSTLWAASSGGYAEGL